LAKHQSRDDGVDDAAMDVGEAAVDTVVYAAHAFAKRR
jgi:hypothetical protein